MEVEKRWISSRLLFETVEGCLQENRQAQFTVTGMSMWPFLCHGRDAVVVEAVPAEQVKKGDIVLLRVNKEQYLLHRVTNVLQETIETTGDGNLYRDGWFAKTQIVARVTSILRNGRKIDCNRMPIPLLAQIWMGLFPWRKPIMALWFRIRPYIRK